MNVYFNSNFGGHEKYARPLRPVPVHMDFQWGELEGKIPALYVGKEGMVVDVCFRIPVEKVEAFLKKWHQENNLSDTSDMTEEAYEELERDNPFSLRFTVDITVDGERLLESSGCSTGWHPLQLDGEKIEKEAEMLMEEYGFDRTCAWLFCRWSGRFGKKEPNLPKTVTLNFRGWEIPFTAGYFETEMNDKESGFTEQKLQIRNPHTGQVCQLTLFDCELNTMEQDIVHSLPREMIFPSQYQMLSYSISPEPLQGRFQILDCAKGDAPIKIQTEKATDHHTISVIGGADGPTAFFLAGKNKEAHKRTAMSALHFEKASKVKWRAVFYEKVQKDLRLTVPLERVCKML